MVLCREAVSQGCQHDSPEDLAEMFGRLFHEKVSTLRASLSPRDQEQGLVRSISFDQLHPASIDEVRAVISSSPSKSCKLDILPTHVVKRYADVLAPPITHRLVNLWLATGVFPASFKCALVTPLIKKTSLDPETLSN